MKFQDVCDLMNMPTLNTYDKANLLKGAPSLYAQDPDVYQEKVIPYMRPFEHHFKDELWGSKVDFEILTQNVAYILNHWAKLFPFAWFGLELQLGSESSNPVESTSKIEELAQYDFVRRLSRLDLWNNRLNDQGAHALACLEFDGLRHLNLDCNLLGAQGLGELVGAKSMQGLYSLSICANSSSDADAEALVRNCGITGLKEFDFSDNSITDKGVEALASCEALSSLDVLVLGSEHITIKSIEALLKGSGRNLRSLQISCAQINQSQLPQLIEVTSGLEHFKVISDPLTRVFGPDQYQIWGGVVEALDSVQCHIDVER